MSEPPPGITNSSGANPDAGGGPIFGRRQSAEDVTDSFGANMRGTGTQTAVQPPRQATDADESAAAQPELKESDHAENAESTQKQYIDRGKLTQPEAEAKADTPAGNGQQRPRGQRTLSDTCEPPNPSVAGSQQRPPLVQHGSASNMQNKVSDLLMSAALMYEGGGRDHSDEEADTSHDDDEDHEHVHDAGISRSQSEATSLAPTVETAQTGETETGTETETGDATAAAAVSASAASLDEWKHMKEAAGDRDAHKNRHRARMHHRMDRWKARSGQGAQEQQRPARGLSLLDEDDQLAMHLDEQALDSLEEAGEDMVAAHRDETNEDSDDDEQHKGKAARARGEDEAENEEEVAEEEARARAEIVAARSEAGEQVDVNLSPATKLEALVKEFGPSEVHMEGEQPERFIADVPAVLLRTVLIKGSLALTNHRLCFLAFLPCATDAPNTLQARERAPNEPPSTEVSPIIKSGPATFHRPGRLRHKRKAWFELRKDSFSYYPSSEKLYQPIGSIRLSGIEELSPHDWKKPRFFPFKVKGRVCSLEFKTEEACLEWRRETEAALFNFRNTAEKVRISLPLPRILEVMHSCYLHFAALATIHVLDEPKAKDAASDGDPSKEYTEIIFGLTSSRVGFMDDLKNTLAPTADFRHKVGIAKVIRATPSPVIEVDGPRSEDDLLDEEADKEDGTGLSAKFCAEFALPDKPDDLKLVKADIVRTIPYAGTLCVSEEYLCFWRRRPSLFADIKLKIPIADLQGCEPARAFRWHVWGMTLHISGHADILFEFHDEQERDLTLEEVKRVIVPKESRATPKSPTVEEPYGPVNPAAALMVQGAAADETIVPTNAINLLPKIVNVPTSYGRPAPMRIFCLTIGSRGDVQPYIALCKGLMAHRHRCTIVSHPEYEKWVRQHGIDFRGVGGDPGALMKLSVEHRIFSPAFFKESIGKFRQWLDDLLRECWEECQEAELLIESPSTMAGIHVAEGLGIPYFRAFTMPWTKTSAYPQAFSVPSIEMGASYNLMTYTLFDQIFWRATSGQINRWRKHMLELPPTDMSHMDQNHVPFIYNFSEAVVPVPNDWGDRICVSGYWFLDNAEEWKAPQSLLDFMEKARKDDKKLCYIGFGSIVVDDPAGVTRNIIEAVKDADVRAIVSKGWSGRMSKKDDKGEQKEVKDDEPIPDEVYVVDSIPHDWLFPRIDIAMHHGGAGTTGASLRAGLVTLIKPFFGDQFFWAQRVAKLGAGARVASLEAHDITEALKKAAQDRITVEKATAVGEKIRREKGVEKAISFIYQHIGMAKRERPQRPVEHPTSGRASMNPSTPGSATDGGDETSSDAEGSGNPSLFTYKGLKRVASPLSRNGTVHSTNHSVNSSNAHTGSSHMSRSSSDKAHSRTGSYSSFLPSLSMHGSVIPNAFKELIPGMGNGSDDASEGGNGGGSGAGGGGAKTEKDKEEEHKAFRSAKKEDERRAAILKEKMRAKREEEQRKREEEKEKERLKGGGAGEEAEKRPQGPEPPANVKAAKKPGEDPTNTTKES